MKTGIELIAQERQEQIEKHNRTIEHDVAINYDGCLIKAAKTLVNNQVTPFAESTTRPFGWDRVIWSKMCRKSHKERLIIAGALIAAEIDRLQNDAKEAL